MPASPSPESTCLTCGKSFSPDELAKKRVLCGKEKTPPTGKSYDPSDCRLYSICSPECVERLEKNQAQEGQKSRIKTFLEKVGDTSARCGVNENDICHIIERITGRREY